MNIIVTDPVTQPAGFVVDIEWMHGDLDAETHSRLYLGQAEDVERFLLLLDRVPTKLNDYGRSDYNYTKDIDFLKFFCGIDINSTDHKVFTYIMEDYEKYKHDEPDRIKPDLSTPESRLEAVDNFSRDFGLEMDWPGDLTYDRYYAELRNYTFYYYNDQGKQYHVRIEK